MAPCCGPKATMPLASDRISPIAIAQALSSRGGRNNSPSPATSASHMMPGSGKYHAHSPVSHADATDYGPVARGGRYAMQQTYANMDPTERPTYSTSLPRDLPISGIAQRAGYFSALR